METSLTRATRLADALEMLLGQEATVLRSFAARDMPKLLGLIEKSEPLVRSLAEMQDESLISALRPKVGRLLAMRTRNEKLIQGQLTLIGAQLARCDENRARLAKVAPLYGVKSAPGGPTRLRAAG